MRRCCESVSGADNRDMRRKLHRHNQREHKPRPRAYINIGATSYASVEGGAVHKREKQPEIATGTCEPEEEILGAAYVVEGVFCCYDWNTEHDRHTEIYRRAGDASRD